MIDAVIGSGYVVAIDGPSGAGKSTVARSVAAELQAGYLDTGAMYRALAWWLLDQGMAEADEDAVLARLGDFDLRLRTVPHAPGVAVGDRDVAREIRSQAVSAAVSRFAAMPGVRRWLIARQRDIIASHRASGKGIVAEGRDTTTVVAPDADLRVLLTASLAERRRRRRLEAGDGVAAGMAARDQRDSQVNDFVHPAKGVVLIDSTGLSLAQVVHRVLDLIATQG